MSTGRPLSVKCPSCRRGQWRREPQVKGVRETGRQIEKWRATRRGRTMRTLTHVACADCGHTWWTTLKAPRRAA